AKRAIVDALTGLFNKRYFVELLDSEARKGKQLSLVMFDLDFFKNYNDTFGHLEGDNLLRAAGQTIQKKCRKMKACRYGGEEFAIIVEGDVSKAANVAEELRRAIESLYPKQAKRVVTASFGVGQRKRGEDIETFIKRVDDALYKSKQSGRNRVCIAN
ncbi:MAG: GGDEF domain-containing protein, partial [Candidatus Pacearchaeota archaeon]|nr:GGDEF domain-containing protein [Candidatus Pacearchaeota archaeon]